MLHTHVHQLEPHLADDEHAATDAGRIRLGAVALDRAILEYCHLIRGIDGKRSSAGDHVRLGCVVVHRAVGELHQAIGGNGTAGRLRATRKVVYKDTIATLQT